MLKLVSAFIVSYVLVATSANAAVEVEAGVDSVGVFKHGLAVVRRTVTLPGDGEYQLNDLPEPVHGTFWIESEATIAARIVEVRVPIDEPPMGFDTSLFGSRARVRFKLSHLAEITGEVIGPRPESAQQAWSTDYGRARPDHQWGWRRWSYGPDDSTLPTPQALTLRTETGVVVLDRSTIASVEVIDSGTPQTRAERVMRLSVSNAASGTEITILYLSKGLTWAPSYAIDVSDQSQLELTQKAVIVNELMDLTDVEVSLITGYPSIEFGHVTSPMSPSTSISEFFGALARDTRLSQASQTNVMSQSISVHSAATAPGNQPIPLTGGGSHDMHAQVIGRHSINRGGALIVECGQGTAECSAEVLAVLPNRRDQHGWYRSAYWWGGQPSEMREEGTYDVVRFTNPLDRPLTTAPATVFENGRLIGQHMLHWTEPGGEVVVPVTRSLRVHIADSESQTSGNGGWITSGTMRITNSRDEPVIVEVQKGYSGFLREADGKPEDRGSGERNWGRDPRRELIWSLELSAGESREIEYSYASKYSS